MSVKPSGIETGHRHHSARNGLDASGGVISISLFRSSAISALLALLLALLLGGCGNDGSSGGDSGDDDSGSSVGETVESTDPIQSDEPTESVPEEEEEGEEEVEPPPEEESITGQVPEELVGEWDGDGEGSARVDKITFFGDGTVSLLYNNRQVLEGPAVVEDSRMTLYVPGGPIIYESWYIERPDIGNEYGYAFESLMLDGVSYVRQIS
ncbi:hypothetical protein OG250_09125 [Streptomyces sp. NBC_00487]|uniref:hypothetical protein n=1 Tax=unclassified Streptomyces TaxID=2593676 RepID=UPI002E1838F1|nr:MULTISPECIES: hypothetical protein [unclassified Streptomyces]